MQNQCVLSGEIVAIDPIRYTPGGVPRQRLWLAHRSRQQEAGKARAVSARIALILAGDAAIALAAGVVNGSPVTVSGFLADSRYRGETQERLELHVTDLVHLD